MDAFSWFMKGAVKEFIERSEAAKAAFWCIVIGLMLTILGLLMLLFKVIWVLVIGVILVLIGILLAMFVICPFADFGAEK